MKHFIYIFITSQQPQDTQQKYVDYVVDQSDALHDAVTKM